MIKKILIILLIISLAALLYWHWRLSRLQQIADHSKVATPTIFYKTAKVTPTIISRAAENKELEIAQLDGQKSAGQQGSEKPPWEEQLVHGLLSFQEADTKLILHYLAKQTISDNSGQAIEVQEVAVSYQRNGQLTGGFSALVDSQSGKILKTWNRLRLYPKDTLIEISEPEN